MPPRAAALIQIDIDDPQCCNPFFVPTQTVLRSSASSRNLKHGNLHPIISEIEEIPGDRIEIDLEAGKARIIDRFGLPEHKERLTKLRELVRQHASQLTNFKGALGDPKETVEYTLHSDNDKATWLWWTLRIVEEKQGKLLPGSSPLPTREEIRAMGDVKTGNTFLTAKEGHPPIGYLPKKVPEKTLEHKKPALV